MAKRIYKSTADVEIDLVSKAEAEELISNEMMPLQFPVSFPVALTITSELKEFYVVASHKLMTVPVGHPAAGKQYVDDTVLGIYDNKDEAIGAANAVSEAQ